MGASGCRRCSEDPSEPGAIHAVLSGCAPARPALEPDLRPVRRVRRIHSPELGNSGVSPSSSASANSRSAASAESRALGDVKPAGGASESFRLRERDSSGRREGGVGMETSAGSVAMAGPGVTSSEWVAGSVGGRKPGPATGVESAAERAAEIQDPSAVRNPISAKYAQPGSGTATKRWSREVDRASSNTRRSGRCPPVTRRRQQPPPWASRKRSKSPAAASQKTTMQYGSRACSQTWSDGGRAGVALEGVLVAARCALAGVPGRGDASVAGVGRISGASHSSGAGKSPARSTGGHSGTLRGAGLGR